MTNTVRFETMDENGKSISIKVLKVSDIQNCPGFIFLPEHYREDGSCRHDEPNCEWGNCTKEKVFPEIFCREHLIMECGEEYVETVYGE